jgi:hypothetical protein
MLVATCNTTLEHDPVPENLRTGRAELRIVVAVVRIALNCLREALWVSCLLSVCWQPALEME